MPHQQVFRQLKSLHLKKYRLLHQLFFAEGNKIVNEILKAGYPVEQLLALQSWIERNKEKIQNLPVPFQVISSSEIRKISTLETPQEVIAVCKFPAIESIPIERNSVYLLLDAIRDPGNMGTLIRIADWFGIKKIFVTKDTVEWTNPKVIQASMGSFVRVSVEEIEIASFFDSIPDDIPIYAADIEGQSIYSGNEVYSGILIIGNEARGLSQEIEPYIEKKLMIPKFSSHLNGNPESLNAAVACGIILGEIMRRGLSQD